MCVPRILCLRGWGGGEGRSPLPSTGVKQVQGSLYSAKWAQVP